MMAVAHAPVGVAERVTAITNSSSMRRLHGDRMAALSDRWPCYFMTPSSKPFLKTIGSIFSDTYIFDPNMLYNVRRTKCPGYLKAINRSGPLSHPLRTDESFGAAISKLRQVQHSPKGSMCSTLDYTVGRSGSASFATLRIRSRYRRRSNRGFQCFASGVGELGSAALAMEWRPAVDQVMLVTSVALAYLAGIVTPKSPTSLNRSVDLPLPQSGRLLDERRTSGQQSEKETEFKDLATETQDGDPWDMSQAKLGIALSRLSIEEKDVGYYEGKDNGVRNPVLSLQALGTGPMLRLLVLALEHLHTQAGTGITSPLFNILVKRFTSSYEVTAVYNSVQCVQVLFFQNDEQQFLTLEVDLINESNKFLPSAEWSKLTLDLLCGSVEPICRTWLAREPALVNTEQQGTALVEERRIFTTEEPPKAPNALGNQSPEQSSNITSQAKTLVLDYLQRSGKTELHMDLLFFLRFQTMRPGACCDYTVMSRHVCNVLEDLVVALADGAAAIYLGRDLQIGGLDSDWPILVRPSIKSTRALERFRNEIALKSWFQRNFTSVVAMFEDRFELWTIERLSNMEEAKHIGSQQLMKDDSVGELRFKQIEFPARRGKELRALTGWRYIYSLYLEVSDIVGPLLEIFVKKLGEAISFLLVRLIGRSLGLIFEGIRQSVRWTSK